jgi:hyperosmotically inducible protein
MHLIKKWSAVLMAVLFLAAAGPGLAAAQSTTEKMKTDVSDSWLTAKTKIALYGDSRVSSTQINVDTMKGVVTLRGTVDSEAAKAAAGEVAGGIDGVKSVKNNLQVVTPSRQRAVEAKDDEITKQVKNRLAKDGRLKSIDVRTDAGVVTLQGKVGSVTDSARASETARQVPGVRSVKNELTSGS